MTIYMIYLGHNKQQLFKDYKHDSNELHQPGHSQNKLDNLQQA